MTDKVYGSLSVKAKKDGGVVIEGYANKAVVDRGNDLIPPEAWKLDEYKRNPIVFFNHDRNIPIGKALEVKVTPGGLKVKAEISQSDAAPVPFIRDMIKERILRTFSVGFDPMDSIEKREDGVNVINQANLLEFSVVSIPMNQESDFELVKKIPTWKTKRYGDAVADVLKGQGAIAASQLHHVIANAQNKVYDFNKKESLKALANLSKLSVSEVFDILAGTVNPIPESFLKAFSKVFVVPMDYLKLISNEEVRMVAKSEEKPKGEDYEEEEEVKEEKEEMEEEEETKGEEEEEGEEEEKKEEDTPASAKFLIAQGLTKELSETLSSLLIKYDLQENKSAIYACMLLKELIVDDKLEVDEAIAGAFLLSDFVDIKEFIDEVANLIADSLVVEDKEEEESEGKQAEQLEGETTPTAPVADKSDDETEFGNPHLTVAKSQLAMSGAMVSELKAISSIMSEVKQLLVDLYQVNKAEAPMPADEEDEEEMAEEVQDEDKEREEEEKSLRMIHLDRKRQLIQNFKKRIESL